MTDVRARHPVWDVYDLYRTARLNAKYYSSELATVERWNFALECILLVAAPTSAVAGLWFFKTPLGHTLWQYFGGIAAIVAVLKPLLALPRKVKSYEGVVSGYRVLEHDLHELTILISQKAAYEKGLQVEFQKALKRLGHLVSRNPDSSENMKLRRKCEAEVLTELPADRFFVPEEAQDA